MSKDNYVHIEPLKNGHFGFVLPTSERAAIGMLVEQLDEFINPDLEESRRLFPTAYPDDPEKDAGYQVLAQSELIDLRHERFKVVQDSLMSEELTAEETETWMAVLNDIRLIIGTKLDISEDDYVPSDYELFSLYENLTFLTSLFVDALSERLPETEQ